MIPLMPPAAATYRVFLDSPLGRLTLEAGSRGLSRVLFPGGPADARDESPGGCLGEAAAQLREYFAGERLTFDLPLDPVGTPFQLAVWEVLRTIPFGTTISYGEQARRLGDPRKARAVGAANGRNPLAIIVPCHRVIGSDGRLVGFASGLDAKRWLLDHEWRSAVAPAVRGATALAPHPRSPAGI